jgi:hypothetical protein
VALFGFDRQRHHGGLIWIRQTTRLAKANLDRL